MTKEDKQRHIEVIDILKYNNFNNKLEHTNIRHVRVDLSVASNSIITYSYNKREIKAQITFYVDHLLCNRNKYVFDGSLSELKDYIKYLIDLCELLNLKIYCVSHILEQKGFNALLEYEELEYNKNDSIRLYLCGNESTISKYNDYFHFIIEKGEHKKIISCNAIDILDGITNRAINTYKECVRLNKIIDNEVILAGQVQ